MSWVGSQPSSAPSTETALRSTSSGLPRADRAGSNEVRPSGIERREVNISMNSAAWGRSETPDVADRRLGDHHPFEAPGHLGRRFSGRAEEGDTKQIAHRDHADHGTVFDNGQVTVVMVREAGPGGTGILVGSECVGVGGHPQVHRLDGWLGAGRSRPQKIALGEDAGHLGAVGDDHRTDGRLVHLLGRCGQ